MFYDNKVQGETAGSLQRISKNEFFILLLREFFEFVSKKY